MAISRPRTRRGASLEERLLAGSVRVGACLRWIGAHGSKGYGHIKIDGKVRRTHQVAHEVWIGSIPTGHEIDHRQDLGCEWRDCIEPTHLRAVTHQQNTMNKKLPSTRSYSNTHICGDRLTRYLLVGSRCCRECTELRKETTS